MKKIILVPLSLLISNFLFAASLDVRGGILHGAFDVDVNGVFYDVTFVDGSFVDVFGDATQLIATTKLESRAFSSALLEQVFIGEFDEEPSKTFGCSPQFEFASCHAHTPWGTYYDGVVGAFLDLHSSASNFEDEPNDYISGGGTRLNTDLTFFETSVYVDWQLAEVPLPAGIWLFGSALLGLIGLKRKR